MYYSSEFTVPATFSKRAGTYGTGGVVGRRDADIAKALLPKGPAIKAPTLARTGPKPTKGLLVPMARLAEAKVGKGLSEVSESVSKRFVSTAQRTKLAGQGKALPGGSFPMATRKDVQNAEHDLGRTSPAKRAAAERLIARRKKALGMSKALPLGGLAGGVGGLGRDGRKGALRNMTAAELAAARKRARGGSVGGLAAGVAAGEALARRVPQAAEAAINDRYGRFVQTAQQTSFPETPAVRRTKTLHEERRQGALQRAESRRRMSKAYDSVRHYDAEDARQRRLGATGAGAAIGGGALVVAGGRTIRQDTRALRELPHKFTVPVNASVRTKNRLEAQGEAVHRVRGMLKAGRGVVVTRGPAARVAGGAALLGAGANMLRSQHKRRWS